MFKKTISGVSFCLATLSLSFSSMVDTHFINYSQGMISLNDAQADHIIAKKHKHKRKKSSSDCGC